jgi:hypothetical protein
MELKSWVKYDFNLNKCEIVGTKPFELNLSKKCRKDFDEYVLNKYSLKENDYAFADVVLDITEFCEKTNYRTEITSKYSNEKHNIEKIIINEIIPCPIRTVSNIDPFNNFNF